MHENRLVWREHSQILNSLNVCRQFQYYLTISHWPSNVNDAKSVWFTGCLHLYSGVEHPCFNQYPEQTDFPDPVKITAILSCNSESLYSLQLLNPFISLNNWFWFCCAIWMAGKISLSFDFKLRCKWVYQYS